MSKGGMKAGQGIILTKPLGTGTIMAAAMRRKAKARWISGTLSPIYSYVSKMCFFEKIVLQDFTNSLQE